MSDSPAGSCCSVPRQSGVSAEGRTDLLAVPAEGMAECPMMAGTPVVIATAEAAGLYRDHEGTRYYFCCAGCGPAFDADPAKYTRAA